MIRSASSLAVVLSCLVVSNVQSLDVRLKPVRSASVTRLDAATLGLRIPSGFIKDEIPVKQAKSPWTHHDFNQDVEWRWAYSNTPDAACTTYTCDNIEGTVPADIAGTFYKTGPAKFERAGRRYAHVLDGDGFVAAFSFENGKVTYNGRFVETEFFCEEEKHDKVIFRSAFGTQRDGGPLANAFDMRLKNSANTNVLEWGGRLFSLWEAGRPYELDPKTLAVKKIQDDDGHGLGGPMAGLGGADCRMRGITFDEGGFIDQALKVGRCFAAHPHIDDPDTLVGFTFAQKLLTKEGILNFVEYDSNWKLKSKVRYVMPGGISGPHDFSLGPNYYGFFQSQFTLNTLHYLLGLKSPTQSMQLLLQKPAILHLVPRKNDGTRKAIQVKVPFYFNIHNMPKIHESPDGQRLFVYTNGWNLADPRFFPSGQDSVPFLSNWAGDYPDISGGTTPPAHFYRTTVNLITEQVESHEEVIPGLTMDFPAQDEESSANTVYCSAGATGYESLPNTGIGKIQLDNEAGGKASSQYWWAPNKTFVNQVVAVPKRNGEAGSWLLTLLFDAAKKRTSFAILDSERFVDGPVCQIHLKHRLTYDLHSTFCERT